jgi:hypothetical protein
LQIEISDHEPVNTRREYKTDNFFQRHARKNGR